MNSGFKNPIKGMEKLFNFETKAGEAKEIKKGTGIPFEIMQKRLDYCAKQEGLEHGYFSSDEDIKKVLTNAGHAILDMPLSSQLLRFLLEKYGDYIWRGYNPNHSHDVGP